MAWFWQKPQYISLACDEGDIDAIIQKKRPTSGHVFKIHPMKEESWESAAPEKMLQVLNGLEGVCSFEIWLKDGIISYYVWTAYENDSNLVKSQISAQYPNADIYDIKYLHFPIIKENDHICAGKVEMQCRHHYPFETKFKKDPMAALLNVLTYSKRCNTIMVQVLLKPAKPNWSSEAYNQIWKLTNEHSEGWIDPHVVKPTESEKAQAVLFREKAGKLPFQTEINIMVTSAEATFAASKAREIGSVFKQFNHHQGNKFGYSIVKRKKLPSFYVKMKYRLLSRIPWVFGRNMYAMTTDELANIVHLPGNDVKTPEIDWALVGQRMSTPEVTDGLAIAKNTFKDKTSAITLSDDDLNTHVALFGRTGYGKSTLIAQMALQKINNGESVMVIDPHGDLVRQILPRIDAARAKDVILVDPLRNPIRLNALGLPKAIPGCPVAPMKDTVIGDLVSAFKNIFGQEYWGPKLDYIFTTVAKGLLERENSTLFDMYYVLTDADARKSLADVIKDPTVKNFMMHDLPNIKYDDRLSTIDKVGKIATNDLLRKALCQRKGTFDFNSAFESKKVILFDLSKGRLGLDNTRLIGSALVTQVWINILQRVYMPEHARKRTYLFVDEFQNFASQSFMEILSESRKYGLSLVLSTQYTRQVKEDVWNGISGNVNTFISFNVGADDAQRLSRVYTDVAPDEFVNQDKFSVIVRKGNRTTQGKTQPLGEALNSFDWDAAPGIVLDDSLASEYSYNAENVLTYLTSVYAVQLWTETGNDGVVDPNEEYELRDANGPDVCRLVCEAKGWMYFQKTDDYDRFGLTAEGLQALKDLIGDTKFAGTDKHKDLILKVFEHFTREGYRLWIIRQEGRELTPDLVMESYGDNRTPLNVEVETTAIKDPGRILTNLAKALNDGKRCMFVAPNKGIAEKIARILATPYWVKPDGSRELYRLNSGKKFDPMKELPLKLKDGDLLIMFRTETGFEEYKHLGPGPAPGNLDSVGDDILAFLKKEGYLHTPEALGKRFKIEVEKMKEFLRRMARENRVVSNGRGSYAYRA